MADFRGPIANAAPRHTQRQVLYVKLVKTGGIVLSRDLYHDPAEMTLNRPTFDFTQEKNLRKQKGRWTTS